MAEPIVLAKDKKEAKIVGKMLDKALSNKTIAKIQKYDEKLANSSLKLSKLNQKQIKSLCASLSVLETC